MHEIVKNQEDIFIPEQDIRDFHEKYEWENIAKKVQNILY
jgi:hypothetical protein